MSETVGLHFEFPNLIMFYFLPGIWYKSLGFRRQYVHKGFDSIQKAEIEKSSCGNNCIWWAGVQWTMTDTLEVGAFFPQGPSRILNHKPWKCIPCDTLLLNYINQSLSWKAMHVQNVNYAHCVRDTSVSIRYYWPSVSTWQAFEIWPKLMYRELFNHIMLAPEPCYPTS